jgi:1-acyl-sn-glycerol-3-phosphate acyltransferase
MPLLRSLLLTWPVTGLIFVAMAILSPISRWLDPSSRHHGGLGRAFSRIFLWCAGIRLRIGGLERLERNGVYVYAVNHESTIDPPVLAAALPPPVRFIAKQELFDAPILGGYLRRGRHVPVRRDDARSAVKSLVEAARCIREERASVLVFAEGTRSDELRAFKGGAAHLAIQCGVPVVPVALVGGAEVLPKGSMLVRPGELRIVIGEPIETASMERSDRDRLTTLLFERVGQLIAGSQEPAPAMGGSRK